MPLQGKETLTETTPLKEKPAKSEKAVVKKKNRTGETMKMTRLFLCLPLLMLWVSGCKEPPPPPKPTPTVTHTPVPAADIVAYTQAGQLIAMDWNGKNKRILYKSAKNSIWFPSASPDGSHFIAWLSEPDGRQNIVRIESDGSGFSYLTDFQEPALPEMKNIRLQNSPVYDSNGNSIAFSFNGNIWIMDSDGYNAVTLINDSHSWSPAWSPDSKRMAYVNGIDGKFDLWITEMEVMDTFQVTGYEDYTVGGPIWNPEGKYIYFTPIPGRQQCNPILYLLT